MIITHQTAQTEQFGTANSIRCLVSTTDHLVSRKSVLRRTLSAPPGPSHRQRKRVIISPYIKVFGERTNDYYYDKNIGLHGGRSQSVSSPNSVVSEPSLPAFNLQRIHSVKHKKTSSGERICPSLERLDTPRHRRSTRRVVKSGDAKEEEVRATNAVGIPLPPDFAEECLVVESSPDELARIHMVRQQQRAFREQSERLSKKFGTIKARTERLTTYNRSYHEARFIRYGSAEAPIGWGSDEDSAVLDLSIKTI